MAWLQRCILGTLAGTAMSMACTTSAAFVCSSDDDCVRAGAAGICTEVGSCAYADDMCPTGWRYPETVGGALGGTCAPGPATTDGGTSSTTASSMSGGATGTSTASTSTTVGPSSSSTTAVGSSGPDATTGGVDGTTGSSTGLACDPDEGDNPSAPNTIDNDDCEVTVSGVYHGNDETDYWNASFTGCLGGTHHIDSGTLDVASLCVGFPCDNGDPVDCGSGVETSGGGVIECCYDFGESVDVSIHGTSNCTPLTIVAFRVVGGGDVCQAYAVNVVVDDY